MSVRLSETARKWLRDAAERVGWTIAQVAIAAVAVEVASLPPAYAVPIAAALALLKAVVARHVGDPASARLGRSE